MTVAPTLPPLAELPLGLRKFHAHAADVAKLTKTSVVKVAKVINAAGSPWNNEFPSCDALRLYISYKPETRTLTVTVQARNFSDREEWGDSANPSSVETWPHEKTLVYSLHDDLPVGTKKFLLELI